MKQTEYESKLIELKQKYQARIAQLIVSSNELAEQQASVRRERAERDSVLKRIKQQIAFYNGEIDRLLEEKKQKVADFKVENASYERQLEEVSDWALVKELVARGFTGEINHPAKNEIFMENLKRFFAGDKPAEETA